MCFPIYYADTFIGYYKWYLRLTKTEGMSVNGAGNTTLKARKTTT